jgi:hypothetical protein
MRDFKLCQRLVGDPGTNLPVKKMIRMSQSDRIYSNTNGPLGSKFKNFWFYLSFAKKLIHESDYLFSSATRGEDGFLGW